MPLMWGNDKINNFPWANEEIARAYWGNDLIYENKPWWTKYGNRIDYIENVNNESYILTDVTPIPNELSLDIDCVFLNDITSIPFGCRPTETASLSSNNIFQINNTLRVDLLGDASLIIPKENHILYNIKYSGVDNVFMFNDKTYTSSNKKSSIEVIHPFAIFANNSSGNLSVGSACIMRYSKFNINEKRYIPIQVRKSFVDNKGVTHNPGDFIMINELVRFDVPTHEGVFTGKDTLESEYYFKSISEQNPYYDLGRRIAYGKRIEIPISFEDTGLTLTDIIGKYYGLFGSRSGVEQNTAYNSFITRNDIPNPREVTREMVPLDKKITITLEDGKGYIDGVLVTSDDGVVVDYQHNSFLYNINSANLGGAMNAYRLPIGTRVYGCRIYDVATGILENVYLPQEDQTLKCALTDEILPKLGINHTDSWEVKPTVWWKEYGNRVECITSDGTAYIDTGYTPQYENGRTEIGVSIVNVDSATSIYGFIERSGNLTNRLSVGSTAGGLFTGSGNTNYMIPSTEANFKYEIDWNRKTGKTILNGIEHNTPNLSGLTKTYPAYLFSRNDNGKPDANGTYNLIGDIYYLREFLEDVPQLNLVPIQVTNNFIDLKGVTHNIGDFIMVNELVELDVPTHIGTFTGK